MNTKDLLAKLSNSFGVSGCEESVTAFCKEQLQPYGTADTDPLGNLICEISPVQNGISVLLDAHIDEIGFIVTDITAEGFLKVASCGGTDRRLLMASEVVVHAEKSLAGVFASMPPHLTKASERDKMAELDDMFIDIGYSKQEAEKRVKPGDRVTLRRTAGELCDGSLFGKSMDNRAGCAVLLSCAARLKEIKVKCGVMLCLSTREEIASAAAACAAFTSSPTHAIVVDTGFAYTPGSPKQKCGKLGGGPMIGISPVLSGEVSNALIKTAKTYDIAFQYDVMAGKTSTNADEIAISRGGIKTGLVSVPIKYMHTPVEVAAVKDIEACSNLICRYLGQLGGAYND